MNMTDFKYNNDLSSETKNQKLYIFLRGEGRRLLQSCLRQSTVCGPESCFQFAWIQQQSANFFADLSESQAPSTLRLSVRLSESRRPNLSKNDSKITFSAFKRRRAAPAAGPPPRTLSGPTGGGGLRRQGASPPDPRRLGPNLWLRHKLGPRRPGLPR